MARGSKRARNRQPEGSSSEPRSTPHRITFILRKKSNKSDDPSLLFVPPCICSSAAYLSCELATHNKTPILHNGCT